MKKKETIKIHFNTYEALKKVRSPYSTMHMTGSGPHKNKKAYDRRKVKAQLRKMDFDE